MQRLPGREEASLSCMVWAQDPVDGSERLFTGGLDGAVTEWDLRTRRPRHVGDSFGGAVWAMAAEPRGQMKKGERSCLLAAVSLPHLTATTQDGKHIHYLLQSQCPIKQRSLKMERRTVNRSTTSRSRALHCTA